MPSTQRIVVNTGPMLALVAGTGGLEILRSMYEQILVPLEVAEEIRKGGPNSFGVEAFESAAWLTVWPSEIMLSAYLENTLDRGEAAVVQLALNEKINTVCIDETVGRRVALLNGLKLTGSIGILLKARAEGKLNSVEDTMIKMRNEGIWISDRVVAKAIEIERGLK